MRIQARVALLWLPSPSKVAGWQVRFSGDVCYLQAVKLLPKDACLSENFLAGMLSPTVAHSSLRCNTLLFRTAKKMPDDSKILVEICLIKIGKTLSGDNRRFQSGSDQIGRIKLAAGSNWQLKSGRVSHLDGDWQLCLQKKS